MLILVLVEIILASMEEGAFACSCITVASLFSIGGSLVDFKKMVAACAVVEEICRSKESPASNSTLFK